MVPMDVPFKMTETPSSGWLVLASVIFPLIIFSGGEGTLAKADMEMKQMKIRMTGVEILFINSVVGGEGKRIPLYEIFL